MSAEHKRGAAAPGSLDLDGSLFYQRALAVLNTSEVPYLLGGAYALQVITGIRHRSKDLDLFVRPADSERLLEVLGSAGYRTEIAYSHWLAKVHWGKQFIDVVFNSGNGMVPVDDEWFVHSIPATVLDVPVRLCPVEETIWQKAFVMERERYDGADVLHLLHARAESLDWDRLLRRFGDHWRVLLSYLVLFGFVYPSERARIPAWVLDRLSRRLRSESKLGAEERVCRGGLLSRAQYRVDLEDWHYIDARLAPIGGMTEAQIAEWDQATERER